MLEHVFHVKSLFVIKRGLFDTQNAFEIKIYKCIYQIDLETNAVEEKMWILTSVIPFNRANTKPL